MNLIGPGCVAVLVVAAVTGCGLIAQPEVPEPQSGPSSALSPTATPTGPASSPSIDTAGVVPGGMDVRYLDPDGTVKELKVKDFPR